MSLYNLDDDVRNEPAQAGGVGLFADGIKFKRMSCDDGSDIKFRLLPAHHPQTVRQNPDGTLSVDPASWIPFRDDSGRLTVWGRKIYVSQFVGHGGKGTGVRRTIMSLTSYAGTGGGETYCPLVHLLTTIRHEQSAWGYLTKDRLSDDKRTILESKALSPQLSTQLLCNIIDVANVQEGVQLGVFSKSGYDKLLSPEGGIAHQRNAAASPEEVAKNPMTQWACGDLTHPTYAPVLSLTKEQQTDRSRRFRGFTITYVTTPTGVLRLPVDANTLVKRYNLYDLPAIVPKPTEEQIVNTLVEVLNGVSPTGEHEYELLRHVFGNQFRIPDPPARSYSTGLGAAPKAASQPPASPTLSAQAPSPNVNPMPQLPAAEMGELPGLSAIPPAPAPEVTPPTPAATPPSVPPQSADAAQAPAAPPQIPASDPTAPPTPAPEARTPAAAIPGDPTPTYDRAGFLATLKEAADGSAPSGVKGTKGPQ